MSVDFSGMQPIGISADGISGQGLYLGHENAPFSSTSTSASTGTFKLTPGGTGDVNFESREGTGSYGTPIKASAFPASGISGTWNCSGSSQASVTVPTPNGPTTIYLSRD
jgi:hypothetical protein